MFQQVPLARPGNRLEIPHPLATPSRQTMISFSDGFEAPVELVAFVQRHVRDVRSRVDVERRAETRHLMVLPVRVQPVDENFEAIGESVTLVSRDISPSGIGLVHFGKIKSEFFAIEMELAGEKVKLIVEAEWQKAFGPFTYIGGRFVAKTKDPSQEKFSWVAEGHKDSPSPHRVDKSCLRSD